MAYLTQKFTFIYLSRICGGIEANNTTFQGNIVFFFTTMNVVTNYKVKLMKINIISLLFF